MKNGLHKQVIKAARHKIGEPFGHHFEPVDNCERGKITLPSCFERGLGQGAYDCSGLVIASLCEVIGISSAQWPDGLRHLEQMRHLSVETKGENGDIAVYTYVDQENQQLVFAHMGILTAEDSVVHSSQFGGQVEETTDPRYFKFTRVIPLTKLIEQTFNK